jgi:hypothetical protein
MATGDILRATLVGHYDGEPINMDLGFVSASGATDWPGEADGLNAEIQTALVLNDHLSAFYAPLSVAFTLDALRIQDLAPGVSAGREYGIGIAGENVTDDALPPQAAICVTWRTDLKGKSNRGRTYLGGFAEDSQNAGYWIPEIQTWAFTAFAQPLLDAFGVLGTGNYALSVIHTQLGGVRLTPPTATPITSFTVHNEVRTLRRRGVGVRISRRRAAS